jgi:hypothetical protein
MLKQFKTWLANNRHFLFSWYTKDSQEMQEPERSLVELPTDQRQQLVDAVENLPINPADKQAISSTLDEAFDRWRENPNNTDNSIVILSSPVTSVSRILSETLQEWTEQKQVSMKLLPLTARPTEIENIKTKLEHYLEKHSLKSDSETQQLEIAVIPNLSWCFLRSIEGLEGIEYLQSLLCDGSKNRFWIIGVGQVGWGYLNSVCNIEAYCGEVSILPAIESEKLQEWLDPIINKLDITFDKPRIDRQFLDGDKDNKSKYFNHLADISQGVSTIAVQAFLKSIRNEQTEDEEEDETKPKQNKLVAQIPRLPNLPALESVDRYLLYSLLLHGDLTIPALAESLGDVESEVQGRVRVLRRQGVIEQRGKVLKINPIHYPKIKQELANNNFIIHK